MEFFLVMLLGGGLAAFIGNSSGDDSSDTNTSDEGDDTVELTEGNDLFSAGGGDDSIDGLDGDDTIFGGSGDDSINGGRLYDDLYGGVGDDTIDGSLGQDLVSGGTGDDTLNGGARVDGLFGGDGNDSMAGDQGDDLLVGGDGDDFLEGGDDDDGLFGGLGVDTLYGGEGDDLLVASDIFNRDLNEDDYTDARSGDLSVNEDGDEFFENFSLTGTSDSSGSPSNGVADDSIFGDEGDDTIFIGHNDYVEGGEGEDEFILGDWSADAALGDGVSLINDFNHIEDIIVVTLDDDTGDTDVSYEFISSGEYHIFINEVPVAIVRGSFDPADGLDASLVTGDYEAGSSITN